MKEGWEYKKLGEVCTVLNGFAFKSGKYTDSGTRIMRITNVQKGFIVDDDPKYYPSKEMQGLNQYILKENDWLMSLTVNVGRVGLLQKELLPAALNQRVACLRIKDYSLSLRFLFHWLNSAVFEQDAIFSASGIAQKNLSTEWLKSYKIAIPPLSEQQHIVEELDLLSSIIEKKKAQLNELDNMAQSLFYEMFGDPITNEKGWEVKTLGKECTELKYGTSKPACENGKYKYLRMGNLTINGELDLSSLKTIDIPDDEVEKCIVRYGDILFNRTNSLDLIGKTCMFNLEEPMVIAGYIIRVRLSKNLKPRYISAMFNLPRMKLLLKKMAKGAVNQANINSKELASILVPIPPLDLQQQFATKIEVIEHQKELIRQSIKEVETLFNSRMDYYFN